MNRTELAQEVAGWMYRVLHWGNTHVPPGFRTLLGFLFMIGGVFGFLPVLGFWMLPLGVAFVALDVPPARRRLNLWMVTLHRKAAFDDDHVDLI